MIGHVGESVKGVGGREVHKVWTYLGMLAVAGGCVLLAVGWSLAAGKSEVALQIPYLMSAALPGVGLIVVGVGLVVVGVRETDALTRRQQQQELAALLTVLRDELAAKKPAPKAAREPAARARRPRKAVE
jgi:hypothetical protein